MQRSYTFAFFAVKDLLLLCCRYVKIFKTRKWHLKYSHGGLCAAFQQTKYSCLYENTTVLLSYTIVFLSACSFMALAKTIRSKSRPFMMKSSME